MTGVVVDGRCAGNILLGPVSAYQLLHVPLTRSQATTSYLTPAYTETLYSQLDTNQPLLLRIISSLETDQVVG